MKFRSFSPMFVYIWGRGGVDGALGLGTKRDPYVPTLLTTNTGDKLELIQIECGDNYIVVLTKNGEVFTWGDNGWGQLGHGDWKRRSVPTKVEALDGTVFIKISCGEYNTFAITDKGELLTWGDGGYGK